eukprot:gene15362-16939_t
MSGKIPPNSSQPILHNFLQAFTTSQGFSPPSGHLTLHQKALFLCWLSAFFVWLVRAIGTPTSPIATRAARDTVAEQLEEGDHKSHVTPVVNSSRRPDGPEPASFDAFLRAVNVLGLIMYYFYICDYVHVFPRAARTYSRDLFVLLALVLFLVSGGLTCKDGGAGKLLNREQTEEWKGWMQVMFVWYHYFRAAELYNAIRVFIAAYVWMTGFGNFSFFWIRRDYSIYRLLKMLFRLNFLVTVVTLVTNNTYMLYYICAMHTFWFLSVYAMMRPYEHLNENRKIMLIKFAIYAVTVCLVYETGIANVVFTPLKFLLGYNDSLHEWLFRSGLDRYATLVGMICAYNHPNFERLLAYFDRDHVNPKERILCNAIKIFISISLCGAIILWYSYVYTLGKYDYNKLHPYTSCIPILTYIFFRNGPAFLRRKHAFLFSWLGKLTLETYISQLHIYMQGNAKDLIVYLTGYPLLNFAVSTLIYLFLSYHLFDITTVLSSFIIPRDVKLLVRRVGLLALVVTVAYLSIFVVTPSDVAEISSSQVN